MSFAASRMSRPVLEPGDVLCFPPRWAHYTESLTLSASVTYRFRPVRPVRARAAQLWAAQRGRCRRCLPAQCWLECLRLESYPSFMTVLHRCPRQSRTACPALLISAHVAALQKSSAVSLGFLRGVLWWNAPERLLFANVTMLHDLI